MVSGGPVTVSPVKAVPELHKRMMETAERFGMGTSADIHGDVEEGFERGNVTIDSRGRRVSTYRAYLEPVMGKRPNSRLRENAQATRILFEGKRAVGIEYLQGGQTQPAHAAREVMLSCGSFNSPQLLMLSGIGPGAHLREMGIDVFTTCLASART